MLNEGPMLGGGVYHEYVGGRPSKLTLRLVSESLASGRTDSVRGELVLSSRKTRNGLGAYTCTSGEVRFASNIKGDTCY